MLNLTDMLYIAQILLNWFDYADAYWIILWFWWNIIYRRVVWFHLLDFFPLFQNITTVLEKFGSNIIFFNGLLDPWSGGGWANITFIFWSEPFHCLEFWQAIMWTLQCPEEYIWECHCHCGSIRCCAVLVISSVCLCNPFVLSFSDTEQYRPMFILNAIWYCFLI
jgi:hypothetical protein